MNSISQIEMKPLVIGVIAFIITVMFDIKLFAEPMANSINEEFLLMIPKIITYITDYMMFAIMQVNHHQLFHQIEKK